MFHHHGGGGTGGALRAVAIAYRGGTGENSQKGALRQRQGTCSTVNTVRQPGFGRARPSMGSIYVLPACQLR